jgi:hypothetical protein
VLVIFFTESFICRAGTAIVVESLLISLKL